MSLKETFTIVNKCVGFCAKRNSGKSVLIKYIVNHFKDKFEKIFLISPTEKINGFFKDVVDSKYVYEELNEKWLIQLIDKMTKMNSNKPDKDKTNILVIFDDVCTDNNMKMKAFQSLFTRGRHLNISIIITMQYIHHLPPVCRANFDYFIVSQMNEQSIDMLYDEFISHLKRKEFQELYKKSIVDYNFLIINCNTVKNLNVKDSIYSIIKSIM
jgi:hypothetical protein